MEIKFAKMNPTQNMTILVESPVNKTAQVRVASELMDYGSVYAEQVGFIEKPKNPEAWARLQMMGGEFCGNATMSLAALLALDQALPLQVKCDILLECSGAEGLVKVETRPGKSSVRCALEMPPPVRIESLVRKIGGRNYKIGLIDLDGIIHFVVPKSAAGEKDRRDWAEKTLKNWAKECCSEAVGLMLHDSESESIEPLVLVKSTGSLIWERGCGSGTAAVGAWLAYKESKSIQTTISQPGGEISVKSTFKTGKVTKVTITGKVKLAARGSAYLSLEK
mgnify:CR=1 FL=1